MFNRNAKANLHTDNTSSRVENDMKSMPTGSGIQTQIMSSHSQQFPDERTRARTEQLGTSSLYDQERKRGLAEMQMLWTEKVKILHDRFSFLHSDIYGGQFIVPLMHSYSYFYNEEFIKKAIIAAAGEFLHKMLWMDTDTDSDNSATETIQSSIGSSKSAISESIKQLVYLLPEALAIRDHSGDLPIMTAVVSSRTSWLVYLVQKAIEHRIFPPQDRGGLWDISPLVGISTLEYLCWCGSDESGKYLEALKTLQASDLFLKEDLSSRAILGKCLGFDCQKRFDFLVDWSPKALSTRVVKQGNIYSYTNAQRSSNPGTKTRAAGNLPIHDATAAILNHHKQIEDHPEEHTDVVLPIPDLFEMFLRSSVRHYPNQFGFLFKKNEDGDTTFHLAVKVFGTVDALSMIQKHIPSSSNTHILHSMIKYTPEYFDLFVKSYHHSVPNRNQSGRLLLHTAMAHGMKLSGNLILLMNCPRGAIFDKDPVTGLYPFMLMAEGTNCDLSTLFYLLQSNPRILLELPSVMSVVTIN